MIDFTLIAIVVFSAFLLAMLLLPLWNVYRARLVGKAALAEAVSESKVRVRNALAEEEAAQHFANAEVIRARGVAQAIDIIGHGLRDNDGYLRYLWIERLNQQDAAIIYVPTEGNLPILEAGRSRDVIVPKSE